MIDYREQITSTLKHFRKLDEIDATSYQAGVNRERNLIEARDQILSTVISEGKVCDECKGTKRASYHNQQTGDVTHRSCIACNGTGKLDITIGDAIKKYKEGVICGE